MDPHTSVNQFSEHDLTSDEELLRCFVEGDAVAFTVLMQRHRDLVYAICWRFFRNDADAEDATQDAFVALYRGAASFTGGAKFTTWMYRVTTNICHDLRRKRVRRPQSSGVDPTRLTDLATDDITALETDLDLRQALEQLRPEHREVIVLHSLLGVPYEEIATRTGVALGTVKSRIHRGMAHLSSLLVEGHSGQTLAGGQAATARELSRSPVLPSPEHPGHPSPGDASST
ncbi:MAG: RNA polymerase sigma factor [Euzebya sp.]